MSERPIRGLSMIQPWAYLLVTKAEHRKRFETRSFDTTWRGLIAVHASLTNPSYAVQFAEEERRVGRIPMGAMARGAIIGIVEIVATYRTEEVAADLAEIERSYGDYSYGRWAWETERVCTLRAPVPCRGALGLWALPTTVLTQVREQALREGASL